MRLSPWRLGVGWCADDTAIAAAQDPIMMAEAMKHGVIADVAGLHGGQNETEVVCDCELTARRCLGNKKGGIDWPPSVLWMLKPRSFFSGFLSDFFQPLGGRRLIAETATVLTLFRALVLIRTARSFLRDVLPGLSVRRIQSQPKPCYRHQSRGRVLPSLAAAPYLVHSALLW